MAFWWDTPSQEKNLRPQKIPILPKKKPGDKKIPNPRDINPWDLANIPVIKILRLKKSPIPG